MFAVMLLASVLGMLGGILAWAAGLLSLPGALLLAFAIGNGLTMLAFVWALLPAGPDADAGRGPGAAAAVTPDAGPLSPRPWPRRAALPAPSGLLAAHPQG